MGRPKGYSGPFKNAEDDPMWVANQKRSAQLKLYHLERKAKVADLEATKAELEMKQAEQDAELKAKGQLLDQLLEGPRPAIEVPYESSTWQYQFLAALQRFPNVGAAAAQAKISRRKVYEYASTDLQFAQYWDDMKEDAIDALEATVLMQAVESGNAQLLIQVRKQLRDGIDTMSPRAKKNGDESNEPTVIKVELG